MNFRVATLLVVLPLVLFPASAAAQGAPTSDISLLWVRLAAGLLLCIFIAVAACLMLKRFSGGAPRFTLGQWATPAGQSLRVLETRRLSLHADACRLVSGDREYLVIVSSGAVAVLRETRAAGQEEA